MSNSRKPPSRLYAEEYCGKGVNAPRPLTEDEWAKAQEQSRRDSLQQIGATLAVQAPVLMIVLESLQAQIYSAMDTNGFWRGEQDNFSSKAALLHSEVSEMLEANRKGIEADDKIPDFTGEEAEAADTLIRLLDMAGRYNWRLAEAVVAKMHFNLSRPFKHGKKY